jgi:hypothetical protein
MFGVFFVLFGGIFVFFRGKTVGPFLYFWGGGGGGCIFWGDKSGGNFVFFGGIFIIFWGDFCF